MKKKASSIVFDDNMKLKDIILANKGFRLFLADASNWAKYSKDFFKKKVEKALDAFGQYPLLETPALEPLYQEYYRDKKSKEKYVTSRYVPLKDMTPERKHLSYEIYLTGKKEDHRGELNDSVIADWKSEYERFQNNALKGDEYSQKNSGYQFNIYSNIFPVQFFSYADKAGDGEKASSQTRQILDLARYFYSTTEGSEIFIPKIDTSLFEDHWNIKDSSWTSAITSIFFKNYADMTIREIKDLWMGSSYSLMKFKSFLAHLSNYKPAYKWEGGQPEDDLINSGSPQVQDTPTKSKSAPAPAPIPTKKEESDQIISTQGIFQIIRTKTQQYVFNSDIYDGDLSIVDLYKYEISSDHKKITYSLFLENVDTEKTESLKNQIIRLIGMKKWSNLMTMDIDIQEDENIIPNYYFFFDISFTAKKGYVFHPFGQNKDADIRTTEVSRKTLVLPDFESKYTKEQLTPPAHLSMEDKIKFVLAFKPYYGHCQTCTGRFNLNLDGTIHAHGYKWENYVKSKNCYGAGKLPLELSKDGIFFEISRLNQLIYKMQKYPKSFKDFDLADIPLMKGKIKQLETLDKEWQFGYYDPSLMRWGRAKYPISLENHEYIDSQGAREVSETILKLGNFKIIFVSDVKESILKMIQSDFEKAIQLIKNSPLKKFKNSLKGVVFVGKEFDLRKRGISDINDAAASYTVETGLIAFLIDSYKNKKMPQVERVSDIVHEFGHKFHNEELPDFLKNKEITSLYGAQANESCILKSLPSKGTLLSDYITPAFVRFSAEKEKWICVAITGKKGEGAIYIFENPQTKEQREYHERFFIQDIVCPSNYAKKDVLEWFAEMCALVTGVEVPRSVNKEIAKQFVKIVNTL